MPTESSIVSIILATHNRKEIVQQTLESLRNRSDTPGYEIIVVDNHSEDGTADVAERLADHLVALDHNEGSCAKAHGLSIASGQFILFLDDDSIPRPGSISGMVAAFLAEPKLGAIGFDVILPDGRHECAALPGVAVGCGVGFRASALRDVGGVDPTFFMQAEEYDWSFRLKNHGWDIRIQTDLAVDHRKTPRARIPARTMYYDVRNNLRVAGRYLPDGYLDPYVDDYLQRYEWLATGDGLEGSFAEGMRDGMALLKSERDRWADRRLKPDALEFFFRWNRLARWADSLKRKGTTRVVFAGLGKNVYAFHRAAAATGLRILALGDDRFAKDDRTYRDTPLTPLRQALALIPPADRTTAIVISDMAVAQARALATQISGMGLPSCHAWSPDGNDYGMVEQRGSTEGG